MQDESFENEHRFHEFDKESEVYISDRKLPHWYQPGTATFVTFRAYDSMPQAAIDLWHRRLRLFLRAHNIEDSVSIPSAVELMSNQTRRTFQNYRESSYHKILDKGWGACVLRNPELSAIVADTLLFYDGTHYDLDRFVVMPNHVHLLAAFRKEFDMRHSLECVMHYSAFKIHNVIGGSGAFWQPEPFDHCIRTEHQFKWVQNYIKENPKKAKLRRGAYHYWERPT